MSGIADRFAEFVKALSRADDVLARDREHHGNALPMLAVAGWKLVNYLTEPNQHVAFVDGKPYRLVECPGGGWRENQPGDTGLRLSHDESIPHHSRPVYRLEPLEDD